MMKSALKRTRDPGADTEANTDGFPQRAAAPSPAPKRLAWCVSARPSLIIATGAPDLTPASVGATKAESLPRWHPDLVRTRILPLALHRATPHLLSRHDPASSYRHLC